MPNTIIQTHPDPTLISHRDLIMRRNWYSCAISQYLGDPVQKIHRANDGLVWRSLYLYNLAIAIAVENEIECSYWCREPGQGAEVEEARKKATFKLECEQQIGCYLVSRSELRNKRGWTPWAIRYYLGDADFNYGKGRGHYVRFYQEPNVLKVERFIDERRNSYLRNEEFRLLKIELAA